MKYPTFTYLGLAGEYKPARSMITLSDDREVLIESCKRIVECNDIKCSVISTGFLVEVWGSELNISTFSNGSAQICGKVSSISIEKKGRGGVQ